MRRVPEGFLLTGIQKVRGGNTSIVVQIALIRFYLTKCTESRNNPSYTTTVEQGGSQVIDKNNGWQLCRKGSQHMRSNFPEKERGLPEASTTSRSRLPSCAGCSHYVTTTLGMRRTSGQGLQTPTRYLAKSLRDAPP